MFNIFSTLNQNLQNFWGDAYDAYQAWKSKVGNVASTINNNLQDFWGDIYDVGSTIKKNVSDFGTNTFNQGKNVASTIKKNVWDYATGQINEIKAIPSQIGSGIDSIQKGAIDLNYKVWNAGMKGLTGKNNATFSDIAPQIKESLSQKTGDYDKEKMIAIIDDMQKQGLNEAQITETIDEINRQDPNFLRTSSYGDKIRWSALKFGQDIALNYNRFDKWQQTLAESGMQAAGSVLGLGGGVIGNTLTEVPWVEYALGKVGQAVTAIPWVKPWMEAYGEFAKANPRAAANIWAVTNIGLTALWSTEWQKMIGKWISKAGQWAKKIITPASPYIKKWVDLADEALVPVTKWVKKAGEVVAAPFKSTINTAKRLVWSPEEIAWTQYAIGSKWVFRNGRNLRPQPQIQDEISLTNWLIRSSWKKPVDVASYRAAIKDEMENIWKEINKLTGQDMQIDMSWTAKKLREKAMSDTVQTLDPEWAKELLKLADNFDRKIWITEAEDMNQFINALLRNKDITAKESVKQWYQQLVEWIRENLDSTIASIPWEFKEIKKAYWALRNVYGDATAKEMVINRKALSSLSESFSAIVENSLDTMDFIDEILSSDFLKMTDAERTEILKEKEFFKPANGYNNVPRLVSATLKIEGLTNLGIIVDANDGGVGNRWDAIKNRLSEKFERDVLTNFSPKSGGIVIREEGSPLTVGVWIMPDNQSNGYLEHFLESMLPSEGKADLWGYIGTTLKDLQSQKFCEFEKKNFQKVLVRTWLAWQKEPGLSYGTALSKGYFNPNVEAMNPFLEWIASTFNLEEVN